MLFLSTPCKALITLFFVEYQDNNSDNMKYKTTFLPRKYKVHIEMSDQNLDLLKTNENIFLNVGMQLKLLKNSVEITAIPSCFWNKYKQSVGFFI